MRDLFPHCARNSDCRRRARNDGARTIRTAGGAGIPLRSRSAGFLGTLGGGIFIALTLEAQESGGGRGRSSRSAPQEIGAWLHVAEDGAISVYTGKVEIGQNIRTSLAQSVAEELAVPIGSVHLVMGDTDRTPFDMGTFGSRTTPTMAPQLRRAAIAARRLLLMLAAERWHADAGKLRVAGGKVEDPSGGQSLPFGELTRGRKLVEEIGPVGEWKVAGNSVPKVNGREIVTGRHRYPSDQRRAGMLYGKVLRPPAFEATLVSLDDGAARKMPGVVVVRDGSFVAVAAPDEETAERALDALKPQWRTVPQPSVGQLYEQLRRTAENRTSGGRAEEAGLYDRVYCPCASRAPRGAGRVGRRQADGVDRDAAALRGSGRTGAGFRDPGEPRAGSDAGHGLRLRWQAHRRSRH